MPTSIKEAIKRWDQEKGIKPEEATEVKLIGLRPPIDRMDENLNVFENCTKLSLSTNSIERFVPLPKLRQLKILSLSRNKIKRIISLEEVGQTLEELWLSYNEIEKLDGLQPCVKLQTLYISNNKISNWAEISKLSQLQEIKSVLFIGNPIYEANKDSNDTNPAMVLKRVPTLESIDCKPVTNEVKRKAESME